MTPGWRSKTILTNRLQTILIWRIIIIKAETERLLIWVRQHHQWRQQDKTTQHNTNTTQHNTTPTPTQQPTPSTNISLKFVLPLLFFWKSEGAMRGCAESRAECRRWWKTVDGWCHCNGHGHCHWSVHIDDIKVSSLSLWRSPSGVPNDLFDV